MPNILLFLTLMIPITWSPGPNNIMCTSIASRSGIIKTIPFILGVNTPIFLYTIATGLGFGALTSQYPATIEILKYAGGIYVFYFAWQMFTAETKGNSQEKLIGFKNGFILSALNVKSITVILLMYSQPIYQNIGKIAQILFLTIAFTLLCIVGHLLWATMGKFLGKFLLSTKALKIQNYTFGSLLVLTGIWIFLG